MEDPRPSAEEVPSGQGRIPFRMLGVIFLTATALVTALLLLWPSQKPMYQGRTVTEWLRSPEWRTQREEVEIAVFAIGKDGLAEVLRLLEGTPFNAEKAVDAIRARFDPRKAPGRIGREEQKLRALWALDVLGPLIQRDPPKDRVLKLVLDTGASRKVRAKALETYCSLEHNENDLLITLNSLADQEILTNFVARYKNSILELRRELYYERQSNVRVESDFKPSNTNALQIPSLSY